MKVSFTPENKCPACGTPHDAATHWLGDAQPTEGDLSICFYCGHLTVFNADLTIRELSAEEKRDAAKDKDVRTAMAVQPETSTMTDHTLGDAPIEEAYKEKMRELARLLDVYFNGELRGKDRPTGFVLMVFPFGDVASSRCNFISNGSDRRDVVTLMKEMIARFEGQPEMKGTA